MKFLRRLAALRFAPLALLLASFASAQVPTISSAPRSPANPIPATYSTSFSVIATNAVSVQWLKGTLNN
jgi:hypothetical protein